MAQEPHQMTGTASDPTYRSPSQTSNANYPRDVDPRTIHRDIAATRGSMDQTADALADRLRPSSIVGSALDSVGLGDDEYRHYDDDSASAQLSRAAKRGGSRLLHGTVNTARRHPLALTTLATGLVWAFFDSGPDDQEGDEDYRRHDRTGGSRSRQRFIRRDASTFYDPGYDDGYGDEFDDHGAGNVSGPIILRFRARRVDTDAGETADEHGTICDTDGRVVGVEGRKPDTQAGETQDEQGSILDKAGKKVGRAAGTVHEAAASAAHTTGDAVSSAAGATIDAAGNILSATGDVIGNAAEATSDAAGNLFDATGRLLYSAAEAVTGGASAAGRETARGVRATGRKTRDYSRQGYRRGKDGMDRAVEDYPLLTGLAALAAGALVGLALPTSRVEDEYFGEQADDVKAAAGTAGSESWRRGRQLVGASGSAAYDEAERQGLDPDSLAGKVSRVVDRVADEAGDVVTDVKDDLATGAARVKDAAVVGASDEGLTPEQLEEKAGKVAQSAKSTATSQAKAHAEKTKEAVKSDLT